MVVAAGSIERLHSWVISLANSRITAAKMEDVVVMMTIIENVANVAVQVVCQETVVVEVVDRRQWSGRVPAIWRRHRYVSGNMRDGW